MQERGLFASNVLDPRPLEEAADQPIPAAVNMPLHEISSRTHELPSKSQQLLVVGDEQLFESTHEALQTIGRTAARVDPLDVPEPPAGMKPRLWAPNEFLEQIVQGMPPDGTRTALDIACGTGRDAVFLASLGWTVTAVDHLQDALDRGRDLEKRYAPPGSQPINWQCKDAGSIDLDRAYDLIAMFFFLDRELLKNAAASLSPGGCLVVATFTAQHRERFGKPQSLERTLEPDELKRIATDLEVVSCTEGWHGERHTARLHAVKLAGPSRSLFK